MTTSTESVAQQQQQQQPQQRQEQQQQVRRALQPRAPWLRLLPEDGWFTLILLALSVYITVFSIERVTPPWAPGMGILTATTSLGLLLGYLAVQQGRLPGVLVHSAAVVLGVVFAFLQTADAVLVGDRLRMLQHVSNWFQRAIVSGGQSSDNTVFLLFLAILTFLLAYISVWLVLRTRRPWLTVLANGVVLLINLNWATPDKLIFLLLFLLVSLLLLVRFTLAENMRRWKSRGLRFSPDLSWDFMQAGAIFAVAVLLVAYLLPIGTANQQLQDWAASPSNPLTSLQAKFSQIFAGVVGSGQGGAGVNFFDATYRLRGTVNLPTTKILHYTTPHTSDDASQYLITETYDSYDGVASWTSTSGQQVGAKANTLLPPSSADSRVNSYAITFDTVPPGGESYLFAPGSEAARINEATTYTTRGPDNVPTIWQADTPLQAGEQYIAAGYVSTATISQLAQVPYPDPKAPDAGVYPPGVLQLYLPTDEVIDPYIKQVAEQATKGSTSMYDAAQHLENYLRAGFTYSTTNPEPPSNEDATVWFLKNKKGFCTFFATAMAMMGRSLGMPTRVALGFTSGTYDQEHGYYVVRGDQAHMWTQVYFGSYGWVNFEPTASFNKFFRAVDALPGITPGANGTTTIATPNPATGDNQSQDPGGANANHNAPQDSAVVRIGLGASLVILLLLLAVIAFLFWWRMKFRGLAPAAGALARVTRLGIWAGAPPSSAQTPNEYAEQLATVVPAQQTTIRQLSSLYSRERWSGEIDLDSIGEAPRLYERIRVSMTPLIVRRLRAAPGKLLHGLGRVRRIFR
jgi:transglutaminase-like putative cysteine protease